MTPPDRETLKALLAQDMEASQDDLAGSISLPTLADLDAKDARITTLEQALRDVEWAYEGWDVPGECPECKQLEPEGHTATCGLAAALRGTPQPAETPEPR